MNRSIFRIAAYLQLGLALVLGAGCTPTQPFFLNESPDLEYYLNTATQIEYPDVDVESLPDTIETLRPLSIGNHDYQFWDLTLEECVAMTLNNAKILVTTSGIAEERINVGDQIVSGSVEQFTTIYDVAIQQSTAQSIPLTIDGNGNRVLPRGVLGANQVGGVEDALAEFDAQASAFVNVDGTDRPQNTTVPVAISTYNTTQQSAISKRTATGGVATIRQQVLYSRSRTPVQNTLRALGSDWTAVVEAEIQHPLMRNRGTLINRIPVVLASLNEDTATTDFEIGVRNLVRDVENAYWDLYVSYRVVAAAIVGRNTAMVTAKRAKDLIEDGVGGREELAQAVGQYYLFRAQLESALAGSNVAGFDPFGVYGTERRLRELMGISPTDSRLIRPVDEPTHARVEYDWVEAMASSLYLSPELRRTKLEVKKNELELIAAKNQILPDVNLSLLYRWVGLGDTLGPPDASGRPPFPGTGSSALGELTGGDFQESSVRLEFTPPAFGARRELTRIRNAKLELTRQEAFLREQERLLVSRLSNAIADVSTHYQLVQTNAQRWQAAEIEVKTRLDRLEFGISEINVVLQSQERRASAQADYYRALGEYNKSLSLVDYLKGTLLANNSITLAEGPWNKKAYWDALERARERSAGHELQYGVTRPGVVRRGPLLNAEAAAKMHNGEPGSFGETMPPNIESLELPEMEIEGDSMGLGIEPHRQPINVPERPLTELGKTTSELLQPAPSPAPFVPGNVVTPAPTPDATPNADRLMPQQRPAGQLTSPIGLVSPIGYEQPLTARGTAPTPVRRMPLPQR